MLMMGDRFTVVVDGYIFVVQVAVTKALSFVAEPTNPSAPHDVRNRVRQACDVLGKTYGYGGLTAQELMCKLIGDAQT